LLADVTLKAPVDWLINQLEHAPLDSEKWRAAIALGACRDFRSGSALAACLHGEHVFWAVRAECASALAEQQGDLAKSVLLSGLKIEHPKVRRSVCRALHVFRDEDVAKELATLAKTDESVLVAAQAAKALGATRTEIAYEALVELLDSHSWAHSIAVGAVEGLGALEDTRAVPVLVTRTRYGNPSRVRRAALRALVAIEPSLSTRKVVEDLLDDRDPFVRLAAAECLGEIGEQKSVGALCMQLAREDAPNVRRTLRTVIEGLRADAAKKRWTADIAKLQDEYASLKARLQRLESKVSKDS
jgi:aminopeptidase N